jgi:hypothetical protein
VLHLIRKRGDIAASVAERLEDAAIRQHNLIVEGAVPASFPQTVPPALIVKVDAEAFRQLWDLIALHPIASPDGLRGPTCGSARGSDCEY